MLSARITVLSIAASVAVAWLMGFSSVDQPVPSSAAAPVSPAVEPVAQMIPAGMVPAPAMPLDRPDFRAMTDVREKKQAFFDYLSPLVDAANERELARRDRLQGVAARLAVGQLSTQDEAFVKRLERRYRLVGEGSMADRLAALLERVDAVPASLVLAQAANESGWGTSRFAVDGNNFFGIWCFEKGCGLAPLRRNADAIHEVARFDTVADGVSYYVRNINTHAAYADLRSLRAEAHRHDEYYVGERLAEGLVAYSERGLAYVREIQAMIRVNDLHRFTVVYGDRA